MSLPRDNKLRPRDNKSRERDNKLRHGLKIIFTAYQTLSLVAPTGFRISVISLVLRNDWIMDVIRYLLKCEGCTYF